VATAHLLPLAGIMLGDDMMDATIRIFKALPIENKKRRKSISKELAEKTIKYGFLFSPEVVGNYSEAELIALADKIGKELGLTGEQANSAFHKSWRKVKEASIERLVMEQLVHYITTYGFEAMGVYSEESVYIPKEKLEVPEIDVENFEFMVIRGYTKAELEEKILGLLESGVALGENTLNDVLEICEFVDFKEENVDLVKNKEAKVALCDYFNIFPKNPTEFLRYMVYKATGKTLLIKNTVTIDAIKEADIRGLGALFKRYEKKYGLSNLAGIFFRFKPLFLAFKAQEAGPVINRIRKLADIHHKPMPENYLNTVTDKIAKGKLDKSKLKTELEKANIFRKIRLAYALKFRTQESEAILYKIRNGRSYATEFYYPKKKLAKDALKIVMDSIVKDVAKNVKGKKIFIPEKIEYALPATEKQFTGQFPSGTSIRVPKDMVVGVHWENTRGSCIDLDLSLLNISSGKFGWDAEYRDSQGSILFSGDMTSAPKPKGASELFYVKRQTPNEFLLMLNFFDYLENVEVPYSLFVAHEQINKIKQNYMVNPNNILALAKSSITQQEKILGLLVTTRKESKFYFCETSIGKSISSSMNRHTENAVSYLKAFYGNTIQLRDVLKKAGAELVEDKEKCDIDLSPEKLEKDTILNLVKL